MLTFKQFLAEKAAGKKPNYVGVDVEQANALLNQFCRNALWMLEENRPIYRGDPDNAPHNAMRKSGFAAVDTTATERASQNTSNWYTVILDSHPNRKDFPLRSRSFIASMSLNRADNYTGWMKAEEPMIIIPSDDAKIGLVGRDDMWDTVITLFGERRDIEGFNSLFSKMAGKKASMSALEDFQKLLVSGDRSALTRFKNAFYLSEEEAKHFAPIFLQEIRKAYSAESTEHRAVTTATMPHKYVGEVWVGGKVVLISASMWNKLREAIE